MESDPQFAKQIDELLGADVMQHMQSGSGQQLLNLPGTQWHHPVENPDMMRLLKTHEHQNTLLQEVLHPDNIGGFGTHYGN